MRENYKYTNTVAFGFDDMNDPIRKELTDMLSRGTVDGWVLHISTYNTLDDKGIKVGDQFRDVEYGGVIKILEVGFSFENSKPFAVCADDHSCAPDISIKYLNELLDIRRWAKMNQYEEEADND